MSFLVSILSGIIILGIGYFLGTYGAILYYEEGEDQKLSLGKNTIILKSAQWGIYHQVLRQPQVNLEDWK